MMMIDDAADSPTPRFFPSVVRPRRRPSSSFSNERPTDQPRPRKTKPVGTDDDDDDDDDDASVFLPSFVRQRHARRALAPPT